MLVIKTLDTVVPVTFVEFLQRIHMYVCEKFLIYYVPIVINIILPTFLRNYFWNFYYLFYWFGREDVDYMEESPVIK